MKYILFNSAILDYSSHAPRIDNDQRGAGKIYVNYLLHVQSLHLQTHLFLLSFEHVHVQFVHVQVLQQHGLSVLVVCLFMISITSFIIA